MQTANKKLGRLIGGAALGSLPVLAGFYQVLNKLDRTNAQLSELRTSGELQYSSLKTDTSELHSDVELLRSGLKEAFDKLEKFLKQVLG